VERTHLVLYDGTCGLCNGVVQFLLQHDARGVFAFAPLQSGTGQAIAQRFGGEPNELTTFYLVTNYQRVDARMLEKGTAAVVVAGELRWPWKAVAWLRVLPTGLLNWGYDIVARHRYRVFGRSDQCRLPPSDFRDRFIDT
jgi:predicted DCC family thiol-disulfide oxidoreductase YuxK